MSEHSCENYHGHHNSGNGMDVFYMMGFVGAAIFFIGKAATFGAGVIGFLKAIVWPVFFVYEALGFLLK